MADQLLSQSDVDALVLSLGRNESVKPALVAVKPAVAATSNKPPTLVAGSKAALGPTKATPVNSISGTSPRPASPKSEIPAEALNSLNAKITELTKQLSQMGAALKQLDLLEKKVVGLEAKLESKRENQSAELQVLQLKEALKKITTNLKGTPGYGVRQSFNCEKCSDEGHVAVMYRCTKCGHERWYGWWPDK